MTSLLLIRRRYVHNTAISKLQQLEEAEDVQNCRCRLSDLVKHLIGLPEETSWMTPTERILLFSLVLSLRPKWYLEIGTFRGGSALIANAAMNASLNREGRLILVDPNPQIAPEHWSLLSARSTLIAEPSPGALRSLPREAVGKVDFALIDGDHSYQGVLQDAKGVLSVMRPGGLIVFHDSFFSEVKQAIDRFVLDASSCVTDYGLLSKEFVSQALEDGRQVRWGGLRAVFVLSTSC